MKLSPLHNCVAIRPDNAEEKIGVIIIPDVAKQKPARGTVLAVGPGILNESGKLVEMQVSKGDKVIYSMYSGTKVDDETIIMRETEILAVVEKE